MATKTIPQLPSASAASLTDLVDASQGGVEVGMTLQQVLTLILSSLNPSGAGSPVGTVTPIVVGQTYYNTTDGSFWVASGLTNSDWDEKIGGD